MGASLPYKFTKIFTNMFKVYKDDSSAFLYETAIKFEV